MFPVPAGTTPGSFREEPCTLQTATFVPQNEIISSPIFQESELQGLSGSASEWPVSGKGWRLPEEVWQQQHDRRAAGHAWLQVLQEGPGCSYLLLLGQLILQVLCLPPFRLQDFPHFSFLLSRTALQDLKGTDTNISPNIKANS